MGKGTPLTRVVFEIRRNPTRTAILAAVAMGVAAIVFLAVFIVSGIIQGRENRVEAVTHAIGDTVTIGGGTLDVKVVGVQRRPLSTFGTVPVGSRGDVAVQVDLEVLYRENISKRDQPSTLGDLLRTDLDSYTIALMGSAAGQDDNMLWRVVSTPPAKDGSIHDLHKQPLPTPLKPFSGSIVFATPLQVTDLFLVLVNYEGRSREPNAIHYISLEEPPGGE